MPDFGRSPCLIGRRSLETMTAAQRTVRATKARKAAAAARQATAKKAR
jgi:hypothetical protein